MRKVIVSVESTLNGVMTVADWSFPDSGKDRADYSRDLLFSSDALLMGRETYEVFATYWPTKMKSGDGPGEEGFSERINTIAKYVASTTLEELTWNNSHLIEGDVAQEVSKLKQQPGMNIVMYGAGDLAYTLAQHGLIDEVHVMLFPVIASVNENSKRVFNDKGDIPSFRLIETLPLTSGIVVLKYQAAGNAG